MPIRRWLKNNLMNKFYRLDEKLIVVWSNCTLMRAKQVSRLRVRFLSFELGFNLGCGSVMFATEVALTTTPTRITGTKKPTFVGLCHFQEESGGRGRIRTSDRLVRSQVLYPAELRVRSCIL